MTETLEDQKVRYAKLLIRIGVNLQPGQSLRIAAELAHAPFVRLVVEAAYQAGGRYVQVDWQDTPIQRSRAIYSQSDFLDEIPEYEIARHQQMADESWARLSLTGPEFPSLLDDVDPALLRRISASRIKKLRFYVDAMMASHFQWCVAAVPTVAWANQIFPELRNEQAVEALWAEILRVCRVTESDPIAAWDSHDERLSQLASALEQTQVRAVRFVDHAVDDDGKARTDLTIGLTINPHWIAASARTPDEVRFLPNMPTEEIFTTPDHRKAHGWVRTSKPSFPLDREVTDAFFQFENGKLINYSAASGVEALDEFFQIAGSQRLGEVALVDVRSPIHQSGLLFHEILFDENAVCHIAFGSAYPDGVQGGTELSREELVELGVNESDTHLDFMIGTETMSVFGIDVNGREFPIMEQGEFVESLLERAR